MTTTKECIKTSDTSLMTPFGQIERLFENMWTRPTSLFETVWPEVQLSDMCELSPSVDIYGEGRELIIKADMPGITKDDLKIEVTGNILTISGEKKKEDRSDKADYYRCERSYGSFERSFELPEGIDKDSIKAHCENGVLEVRLMKTGESVEKTRKISIE